MKKVISLFIAIAFCLNMCAFAEGDFKIFNKDSYKVDKQLLEYMISGIYPYSEEDFLHFKSFAGQRPRMLIDSEKLEYIRSEIGEGGAYKKIYDQLIKRAEELLKTQMPPWNPVGTTNAHRPVGDAIGLLATAYLISGDERYYYGTAEGCYGVRPAIYQACVTYLSWGVEQLNNDLVCSHMMHGIGIAYDFCHDIIEPETKELILETVAERGGTMYAAALKGFKNWAHNHPMINYVGLSVFALAAFEDFAPAESWLRLAFNFMNISFRAMSDDGGWHEGIQYSQYMANNMTIYALLAEKFFNTDFFSVTDFFKNYGDFLLYMGTYNEETDRRYVFPINNVPDRDGHDPVAVLYTIANKYNDGYAQYLANQMTIVNPLYSQIFMYNPDVEPRDYKERETTRHFYDHEILTTRASWNNNDPMLAFKCGPHHGHKKTAMNTGSSYAGGHADPDIGHFLVMGYDNEWIFKDDGSEWGYYSTKTDHHNTLIINGTGQIGDGGTFMSGSELLIFARRQLHPQFETIVEDKNFLYAVGNATPAYDSSLGLQRFKRHFLYVKPGTLIILDDIKTDGEKQLNLRFLPESSSVLETEYGFTIIGQSNRTDIFSLTPIDTEISVQTEELLSVYSSGKTVPRTVINYNKTTDNWVNAVGISWERAGSTPKEITMEQKGTLYTFEVGSEIYTIDIEEQKVERREVPGEYYIKVNGKSVIYNTDSCKIYGGSLYGGYKELSDVLGLDIKWDESKALLEMAKGDVRLGADFKRGEFLYYGNEELKNKNASGAIPRAASWNLLLPVRFIGEAFGYMVRWIDEDKTAQLISIGGEDASGSAALAGIFLNGEMIEGFDKDVLNYLVKRRLDGIHNFSFLPASRYTECEIVYEENGVVFKCHNRLSDEQRSYVVDMDNLNVFEIVNVESNADEGRRYNTIDKNRETYWAGNGIGAYLTFELAEKASVSGVGIAFSSGNTRKAFFEIHVSEDGQNWTKVFDGESSGTTVEMEGYEFPPVNAKYVKFYSKGNSTNLYATIFEFTVFSR